METHTAMVRRAPEAVNEISRFLLAASRFELNRPCKTVDVSPGQQGSEPAHRLGKTWTTAELRLRRPSLTWVAPEFLGLTEKSKFP